MSFPERRSLTIDGQRALAWRELGSGPPLLLINGYAATADDWAPDLLSELAAGFHVICPDNRGVGGSGLGDPARLSIGGIAADLERLLDHLELDGVTLAGWSMGGFVAQRLEPRAPGRVLATALLSTDPGGPGAVRADPAAWARLVDRSGTPREQATRLIELLFPPAVAPSIDEQFGEIVADARAKLSPSTLDAQSDAVEAWYRTEPEAGSEPPALVLCGSEDVVIPPANADLLAARRPGSIVERYEGCGHAFMAQEPARTAALIRDFALRG
jgi:3-oxoadipate enol-lactonase